jgi:hypothetical protein
MGMNCSDSKGLRLLGEEYLTRRWKEFNSRYFFGALTGPHIRVEKNRSYSGEFSRIPGRPSEIRINSALLTLPSAQARLDNTLLHEMVHQYVEEIEGGDEWAHGLRFFTVANRIGAELSLPFCSQDRLGDWPDHVDVMLAGFRDFSATAKYAGGLYLARTIRVISQLVYGVIPRLASRAPQHLKEPRDSAWLRRRGRRGHLSGATH